MVRSDYSLDLNDLAHRVTLTVRVTGKRRLQARWWVCRQLIRLAAYIGGVRLRIDVSTR